MKERLLGIIMLILMAPLFFACGDDDDTVEEYYVRYSMGIKPGDDVFMSLLEADGEKIVQQVSYEPTVSYTVGPVYKGFEASLSASVNGGHAAEYLQIEISRDNSPFVTAVYLQHGTHIFCTVGE